MSNTAWLIVALLIVAVAIGGYVFSVVARTKTLEKQLQRLREGSH
jgi:CcmD family protein